MSSLSQDDDRNISEDQILSLLKSSTETIDSISTGPIITYLSKKIKGGNDTVQNHTFHEIVIFTLKAIQTPNRCSSGKVARRLASDGLLLLPGPPSLLKECVEVIVSSESTTGMELLLAGYLVRLDPEDGEFVDKMLDQLCCVPPTGCLLAHKAAVISAALRELEGILPDRLSRKGSNNESTDRIESLLNGLLHCLQDISSSHNLPPLIYQLCLFLSSVPKCTDEHRIRSLSGISSRFDRIPPEQTDNTLKYNTGTALSHISTAIRQNQNLSKSLHKLIQNGDSLSPYPYKCLTPFRAAMLLSSGQSLPRTRLVALQTLRDLMMEEELTNVRAQSSAWLNHFTKTLSSDPPSTQSPSKYVLSTLLSVSQLCTCCSYGMESLIPSLVQLGFLLIDSAKNDTLPQKTHAHQAQHAVSTNGFTLLTTIFHYSDDSTRNAILRSSSEKFCGRAPNGIRHSQLLCHLSSGDTLPVLSEYTSVITEYMANLSTGGLIPDAARRALIPTLQKLLPLRKQNLDACFLFTKKALFCDEARRIPAAASLVMILSMSEGEMREEVRGYLKRCLTQHSCSIRMEIYERLMELEGDVVKEILCRHLERYVVVQEGEEERRRRKNRAMELGSQLSNQEEGSGSADEGEVPLCLDLCLGRRGGEGGSLLTVAQETISEPLPYLIGCCILRSKSDGESQHHLINLRSKVAGSSFHRYLERENDTDKTKPLALSLLVASTSEILMDVSSPDEADLETIEKLFILRTEAVENAVKILAFSSKKKQPNKKKKAKKKKNNEDEDEEEDDFVASAGSATPSATVIERARKSVEDTLTEMTPALSFDFIASKLRDCGAGIETREEEEGEKKDENGTQSSSCPRARLNQNLKFRRFLLSKSLSLLSSRSPILHQLHLHPTNQSHLIASSLQLGPLLFLEFTTHVRTRVRTSLSKSSKFLPLALLSLRGFRYAIETMAMETKEGDGMKREKRVLTLMKFAFEKVKETLSNYGWEDFGGEEEVELMKFLRGFVSPPMLDGEQCRGGLLSELISHGMEGEATECVELVKAAAGVLEDVNLKQSVGVFLLRAWEHLGEEVQGPLGLDRVEGEDGTCDCPTSSVRAVEVATELGGGLCAGIPIPVVTSRGERPKFGAGRQNGSDDDNFFDKMKRLLWGIPTAPVEDWPDLHQKYPEENESFNIVQKTSLALLFQLSKNISNNFENDLKSGSPLSKKRHALSCVKVIVEASPAAGCLIPKELSLASSAILNAVENPMSDVEFVLLKILPTLKGEYLEIAQKYVAGCTLAIARVINTMAPCADRIDDTGNFSLSFLRNCKRLFAVLTKLALSHLSQPKTIMDALTRKMLMEMTTRTTPRILNLLLTIQEKSEAGKGKVLADSKIESYGRVAAQLVFEKERSDKALLKLSEKLKSDGFVRESSWIERGLVTSTNRDFRIKRNEIKKAQAQEAPVQKKKKKRSGEGNNKAKKKQKKTDIDEGDVNNEDDGSSDNDEDSVLLGDGEDSVNEKEGSDDDDSRTEYSEQTISDEEDDDDGIDDDE